MPDQVFWDNVKKDPMGDPMEGSTMYRRGEAITFEGHMYDHEDNRLTSQKFTFGVEEYRRALAAVQRDRKVKFKGTDCSVEMEKESDGSIRLLLSGDGHAIIPGTLEKFLLKE